MRRSPIPSRSSGLAVAIQHRPRQHAFTLIEVMVALVVIALGMAAVIRSTGAGASNAVYLREKTIAHWVAVNKLTELQLQKEWAALGSTSGTYEMSDHEWRWETKVSETDEPAVRRVDVKVLLSSRSKEALAELVGYTEKPL